MSASVKPTFGFEGLADIQPGPVTPTPTDMPAREIDRAGERIGFQSREAVRRKRRQVSEEPTDQINIRAAIADINVFVEWCERERLTYGQAFAELVKRIG